MTNNKTLCQGKVWRHHYYYSCGNPGAIEEEGKKWCGIHAPSKAKAKAEKSRGQYDWKSKAWDFDSKIRGAESEVMAAAQNVYKSQIGAGWEMEQQRIAVQRLVKAYGTLESIRTEYAAHDAKRPDGIRKV